jgi:hypothetical protein
MRDVIAFGVLALGVYACSTKDTKAPQTANSTRALEFLGARINDPLDSARKNCGYFFKDTSISEQTCMVNTQPKIGDVRIKNMMKTYLDRKLISWGFDFDFADYGLLVTAFTTKYGVPDSAYSGVAQMPEGSGRFGYEGKYWTFADGRLGISREKGEDGHGAAQVLAEGRVGIAEFRRRSTAAKAAKEAAAAASVVRDLGAPTKTP